MSIPLVLILGYVGVFAVNALVVAIKVRAANASSNYAVSVIGDTLVKTEDASRLSVAANESSPTSLAA